MELATFIKSVKATLNGAAGGRSALTGDHIRPLLDNHDAMSELQRVVTLLINGQFPMWAHPYVPLLHEISDARIQRKTSLCG
jgi:hypothetical protein